MISYIRPLFVGAAHNLRKNECILIRFPECNIDKYMPSITANSHCYICGQPLHAYTSLALHCNHCFHARCLRGNASLSCPICYAHFSFIDIIRVLTK